MQTDTPKIQQAIEAKLNELETIEPSEHSLSRETRKYALEQIAQAANSEQEALDSIKQASLGELAQVSMF